MTEGTSPCCFIDACCFLSALAIPIGSSQVHRPHVTVHSQPSKLPPGTHPRAVEVASRQRSYLVHVPKTLPRETGWPVVLAFHGGGTNARIMMRFSALNDKAESAGFLAVYPNGSGRTSQALTFNAGNCCGYAMRQQIDDVQFVEQLLDDLTRSMNIDPRRIYATGMSNGAMMCYELASQLSHRIAAIAPVAGPMGRITCAPSHPVSVCHFHGTADAFAPYAGGRGKRSITKTDFLSVAHSIETWVAVNGCSTPAIRRSLPPIVADGTSISRDEYLHGHDGTRVVLYTIAGGGHTWPGETPSLQLLGKSTKNLSANDVLWDFFEAHSR